jgi:predicted DNA repair protein MutK
MHAVLLIRVGSFFILFRGDEKIVSSLTQKRKNDAVNENRHQ